MKFLGILVLLSSTKYFALADKLNRINHFGGRPQGLQDAHAHQGGGVDASNDNLSIPILEDIRDGPFADGSYYFRYSTGNGILREEASEPVAPDVRRVTGSYAYTAPNGEIIEMVYMADHMGYRAFRRDNRNSELIPPPKRVTSSGVGTDFHSGPPAVAQKPFQVGGQPISEPGRPGSQTFKRPLRPATQTLLRPVSPASQTLQRPVSPASQTHQRPGRPASQTLQRPVSPASQTLQRPGRPASQTLQRPGRPASQTLQRPGRPASQTLQRPVSPASQTLQRPVSPASQTLQRPGRPASQPFQRPVRPSDQTLQRPVRPITHALQPQTPSRITGQLSQHIPQRPIKPMGQVPHRPIKPMGQIPKRPIIPMSQVPQQQIKPVGHLSQLPSRHEVGQVSHQQLIPQTPVTQTVHQHSKPLSQSELQQIRPPTSGIFQQQIGQQMHLPEMFHFPEMLQAQQVPSPPAHTIQPPGQFTGAPVITVPSHLQQHVQGMVIPQAIPGQGLIITPFGSGDSSEQQIMHPSVPSQLYGTPYGK